MTPNEIKRITSLHVDKFRKEQQRFLVEGPKLLEELLCSNFTIKAIYALDEWIDEAKNVPRSENIIKVSPKELSRISQLKTPNQLVTEVAMKDNHHRQPPSGTEWIIALDNINNPGNLGTIIRTADWFGFQHIVCSANCADFYNPKVIQSTMGSFTRINVYYTDLEQWLAEETQHTPLYGATMDGTSLYDVVLPKNGILLIGNESHGISKNLYPLITQKIKIPAYGGKAESLNASIATAVIAAELRRP
ncbi:MAG: RNA methyltransferase [Bacteroidales bacterium]|nr:RNA methyltransferase [Bacteroidales bacterium]